LKYSDFKFDTTVELELNGNWYSSKEKDGKGNPVLRFSANTSSSGSIKPINGSYGLYYVEDDDGETWFLE